MSDSHVVELDSEPANWEFLDRDLEGLEGKPSLEVDATAPAHTGEIP